MKLGHRSPAQLDYWRTSEVVNIETPEGGTVANRMPKPKLRAKRKRSTTKPSAVSVEDLAMLPIQQIVDPAGTWRAARFKSEYLMRERRLSVHVREAGPDAVLFWR